jgi:ABC-type multidrug transport system permease subunit
MSLIDAAFINGITMLFMQLGSRNFKFNFTEAQQKLLAHPVSQVLLLTAMFYAPTRNIFLSILIVALYYLITYVLLNELHPLNLYSTSWLKKEGFVVEDFVKII